MTQTVGKSANAARGRRGRVQVTMCYYGAPLRLDCDRIDRRDEIIVEQQPCGGNAVVVYSGKLLPGGEISLSFVSKV